MNKQQGSAHVIVVGVLVVALLGALGFIFWQNFVKKDEAAKKAEMAKTTEIKQEEPEKGIKTKVYDGPTYTFSYPSDGWLVTEITNNYDSGPEIHAEVRTTDYKPFVGLGIERGAKVAVFSRPHTYGSSLEQDKKNTMMALPDMEDIKDITLGGVPAYSYGSGYEGYRYTTSSIKDGTYYQIVYQFADGINQSVHRNGYDMIVDTFKFK